jgi:hypothetical protein
MLRKTFGINIIVDAVEMGSGLRNCNFDKSGNKIDNALSKTPSKYVVGVGGFERERILRYYAACCLTEKAR